MNPIRYFVLNELYKIRIVFERDFYCIDILNYGCEDDGKNFFRD